MPFPSTSRRVAILSLCALTMGDVASAQRSATTAPHPFANLEDVYANLRARVAAGFAPSFMVAVVDQGGTKFTAIGHTSFHDKRPVNEHTIYEIGSITKVFTAILLADMSLRGEVGLDDPVQRYLPDSVRVPSLGATPITLRHLATHRSGLPRVPSNIEQEDSNDPYAHYDASKFYAYLRTAALAREPGAAYEYSNLGAGLLGHALERRAGIPYAQLVHTRVLAALDLTSTFAALPRSSRSRVAPATADGRHVSNWSFDVLAGAGALRSSAHDLARFLSAAVQSIHSPLDSAFALAATASSDAGGPTMRIGLGWHIWEGENHRVVWHEGITGGYRSLVAFDPAQRKGVAILTNSTENLDDVARHLFVPSLALAELPAVVPVSPAALDAYVGEYRLTPAFSITVRRDADQLLARATGQFAFRLWPGGKDRFFYRVVDARVTFTRGANGRVDGLVLHQAGLDQRADRLR